MANTVVENLQLMLREEITPGLRESLPEVDGVFKKIVTTDMGVTRDGIGRDYKVKHTFAASLAGAFQWKANPFGSAMNANVTPSQMIGTPAAFPGYTQATQMGILQRTIALTQGSGNFFLPIQLFQMDELNSAVFQYVGKNIQMVAKLVAQLNAVGFYAPNAAKALAVIPTSGVSGGSTATVTVTLSATGTGVIRNFYPGMLVDVQNTGSSYTSRLNAAQYFVVKSVDYLNRVIVLITSDGSGPATTVADADTIVSYGSSVAGTGYGPSGLETWLVNTGTPYGITLTTYPQFKSLVAAVNDSLTETVLNKYVGAFLDAYGIKLDTFITRSGVVREMLNQVSDLGQFQRQGQPLKYEGGWTDIGYTYNGQSFDWLISPYCAPGKLYGLKMGSGNIKRYVPPRVPGTATRKEFDGEIQFVAPWGGSSSIFKPLHNGDGATTEIVEAPFLCLEEKAPDEIQGINLSGLTELNP